MEFVAYFFRFVYRIKWWLILVPITVGLYAIHATRNLSRTYDVHTTIYTGLMSGYNVGLDGSITNINVVNNTINNLINIIQSKSTLRQVSMRLYAQHMMYGDPEKDNNYIKASNYRHILSITPQEVRQLIDKDSEENTLKRLYEYANANTSNFLYGLYNWAPPFYSYDALKKIKVERLNGSDMLEISYATNDPGITYHTLRLLNEEFMKQYENLQFGETNKVIEFFEEELQKISDQLRTAEDSLTQYNINKKIINYGEQTAHLTALHRDYQLQQEDILLQYNAAKVLVNELETRLGNQVQRIKTNTEFIHKLDEIAHLSAQIARAKSFGPDSLHSSGNQLAKLENELSNKEEEFRNNSEAYYEGKNSKEGYPVDEMIKQWLVEILRLRESESKLIVLKEWGQKLDEEYRFYSPVGSTLKRKEREINFTETTYLEILNALNTARLRQKSIQMNSATVRILNEPTYPLASAPTKRKLKIITASLASFIFIFGFLLLREILDRTLRNRFRTELITSGKVISAFPDEKRFRYRNYIKAVKEMAGKALGNKLLYQMKDREGLIINLISTEKEEGKSYIGKQLEAYFQAIGLQVFYLCRDKKLPLSTSSFIDSAGNKSAPIRQTGQITMIEHAPLKDIPAPVCLLSESQVNLLVVCSNRTWNATDRMFFTSLKEHGGKVPIWLVLNKTKREEAEYFTGLLPPYSLRRRILYRLFHMGLSSTS